MLITRFSAYKYAASILLLLILLLAACTPQAATPQPSPEPTRPAATAPPTAAPTQAPAEGAPELAGEEVLMQLTFEPGFSLPEYRYVFGRTPSFTLLADGRVIYIDEARDFSVMQARLAPQEATALLQQVREMGFGLLESHTEMCGLMPDGQEACVADAQTNVMRVRMEDGSLREIRNYASFSNGPATYTAIYALMEEYTHPEASLYLPQGATLFVRIAPPPEMGSPADWPLDPSYVQRAQAAPDQFIAVALSAAEAAKWQQEVGLDNNSITFQLNGQPVAGFFAPWLPGDDFTQQIAAEFPAQ